MDCIYFELLIVVRGGNLLVYQTVELLIDGLSDWQPLSGVFLHRSPSPARQ